MDDKLVQKRNKAKKLKIIGMVLMIIELVLACIGMIFIISIGFNKYEGNKYYNLILDSSSTIPSLKDESTLVDLYSKNNNVYCYLNYYDCDKYNEYSETYILNSYDSEFYYLKNSKEIIKLPNNKTIDYRITEFETSASNATDIIEFSVSTDGTLLNKSPYSKYLIYDAGDTLGVKAVYEHIILYKSISHNNQKIEFEYVNTYVAKGVDIVTVEPDIDYDESFDLDLKYVIQYFSTENDIYDIIASLGLSVFLGLVISILEIMILFSAILCIIFTFKSFYYVNYNNRLKKVGIITFVFIFGALLYFGAKNDSDFVYHLEEERKNDKIVLPPISGAILSGYGGLAFSLACYLEVLLVLKNANIIKINLDFNSITSLFIFGIIMIGFGIISIRVNKKNKEHIIKKSEEIINLDNKPSRFCIYCGTKLEKNTLFCSNCGSKVEYNKDDEIND